MVKYLNSKGINTIYLDKEYIRKEREILIDIDFNNIENNQILFGMNMLVKTYDDKIIKIFKNGKYILN